MLDRNGRFIPPLKEMVRTMRARPIRKAWHSGRRLLRKQIQRDFTPVNAARWSGRQFRLFRKFLQREDRAS